MGKSLVIVESPAKAKTINKYLGSDYIVKVQCRSYPRLNRLPVVVQTSTPQERAKQAAATRKMSPEEKVAHKARKAKEQLIARMGIDPENNWDARYEVLPGKEKVVTELRKLAKSADQIFLATDLDREGEAIAWHLKEAIGGDDERYKRVVFNEITKKAIQEAFEVPTELDQSRVDAQQARRFLDRRRGFYGFSFALGKSCQGLISRSCPICCCALDRRARKKKLEHSFRKSIGKCLLTYLLLKRGIPVSRSVDFKVMHFALSMLSKSMLIKMRWIRPSLRFPSAKISRPVLNRMRHLLPLLCNRPQVRV